MICVIPFCSKDSALAHDLLLWCGQLGGTKSHPCLLVCDAATSWNDAWKAVDLAEKAFASVKVITNGTPVEGWIAGSNSLFKAAAEWCSGQPFMWLEPDACPLRKTWLDELESAYAQCGKPFLGTIVNHLNAHFPNPYFEGNGVYPPDCWQRFEPIWNPEKSWTYAMSSVTVPNAVHTDLIEHVWGMKDNAPTFSDMNIPGTSVFSLAKIKPKSAVWHRNKDGSLIRLLRKRMGIHVPETNGHADFVSLRRAGDIIALLPICERLAHKRNRPIRLVVHKDFTPLLEGTSYIEPVEWDGDWESPLQAASKFQARNAQVFGKGIKIPRLPSNFVTEAWKMIGQNWNRYLPLEFDRRDPERERRLAESTFHTDKPKVLVKLHGFSSPFPHTELVKARLRQEFDAATELVWLDEVKAERLYDLLGLMDRAACLISIDTALLHLNRSHPIPTIALVNGSQWGSSPRVGNVVFRCPYAAVPGQWKAISDTLRKCLAPEEANDNIALVYSHWVPKDPDTARRNGDAFKTWDRLGARLVPHAGGRSSSMMGDSRAMPFIHDMVDKAMAGGNERIIAIVNNDIAFDERLAEAVKASCRQCGCYWAHRLDKPGGVTDNGVDFFAFTRKWWSLHKHLFPDFLIGYCWFDDMLARIMIWSGCPERERLYYHETHPLAVHTRPHTPGAIYNEKLARKWLATYREPHLKPIDLLAQI